MCKQGAGEGRKEVRGEGMEGGRERKGRMMLENWHQGEECKVGMT